MPPKKQQTSKKRPRNDAGEDNNAHESKRAKPSLRVRGGTNDISPSKDKTSRRRSKKQQKKDEKNARIAKRNQKLVFKGSSGESSSEEDDIVPTLEAVRKREVENHQRDQLLQQEHETRRDMFIMNQYLRQGLQTPLTLSNEIDKVLRPYKNTEASREQERSGFKHETQEQLTRLAFEEKVPRQTSDIVTSKPSDASPAGTRVPIIKIMALRDDSTAAFDFNKPVDLSTPQKGSAWWLANLTNPADITKSDDKVRNAIKAYLANLNFSATSSTSSILGDTESSHLRCLATLIEDGDCPSIHEDGSNHACRTCRDDGRFCIYCVRVNGPYGLDLFLLVLPLAKQYRPEHTQKHEVRFYCDTDGSYVRTAKERQEAALFVEQDDIAEIPTLSEIGPEQTMVSSIQKDDGKEMLARPEADEALPNQQEIAELTAPIALESQETTTTVEQHSTTTSTEDEEQSQETTTATESPITTPSPSTQNDENSKKAAGALISPFSEDDSDDEKVIKAEYWAKHAAQ